jgi:hypothetical protein
VIKDALQEFFRPSRFILLSLDGLLAVEQVSELWHLENIRGNLALGGPIGEELHRLEPVRGGVENPDVELSFSQSRVSFYFRCYEFGHSFIFVTFLTVHDGEGV